MFRSWYYWLPFSRRSRFRSWTSRLSTKIKFFIWALPVATAVGGLAGGILLAGKNMGNLGDVIAAGSNGQSGILLVGHIYDVDVDLRNVQISWLIDGCGSYQMPWTMSYDIITCGRLNATADFYLDGSIQASGSYDWYVTPYEIDGDTVDGEVVYVQAINEFQTSHLLEVIDWNGVDQLYAYPFDSYYLDTSVVAIDPDTNSSIPLLSVSPVDSTDGFTPYILETYVIQRSDPTNKGNMVGARYVRIALRRTILTQFFVMSLFFTNWALTGIVVYITICANDGMEMKNSILVLPLSVVVTIPTLRSLWIGAPAFGLMLDTLGIFMQLSIIALCSIFLVIRVGLSSKIKRELRKRRHRRQHTSDDEDAAIEEYTHIYRLPSSWLKAEGSGKTLEEEDESVPLQAVS